MDKHILFEVDIDSIYFDPFCKEIDRLGAKWRSGVKCGEFYSCSIFFISFDHFYSVYSSVKSSEVVFGYDDYVKDIKQQVVVPMWLSLELLPLLQPKNLDYYFFKTLIPLFEEFDIAEKYVEKS